MAKNLFITAKKTKRTYAYQLGDASLEFTISIDNDKAAVADVEETLKELGN